MKHAFKMYGLLVFNASAQEHVGMAFRRDKPNVWMNLAKNLQTPSVLTKTELLCNNAI